MGEVRKRNGNPAGGGRRTSRGADSAEGPHRGRRRKGKGKKGKGIVSNLILIVALAVFAVSAYQLFKIGKGYYDGRSEYDKIRDLAIETKDDGGDDAGNQPRYQVNFDELMALNSDTIGWIRFDP